MVLDGLRVDTAPSPSSPGRICPVANYRSMKTALRVCFVQTLQRVKVNCFSGEQRGFYECTGRGQNKISFSTFGAGCSSFIARRIPRASDEILQRNGSETTSTGIA